MLTRALAGSFHSFAGTVLLIAAGFVASTASARDFEIRYYETLEPSRIDAEHMSFVAYGRQFDLVLESNSGIVAMPTRPGTHRARLYRGHLAGQTNSWVRISESSGRLSGAIWDGAQLWLVDSREALGEYLMAPGSDTNGSIIFRISELSGALGDAIGSDIVGKEAAGAGEPAPQIAQASFGQQPGRMLDIGLVATSDFAERHGDQANDILLEMFNVIEGIFITQVGVQLRAANVSILDQTPTELDETDPQTLLGNFSAWKQRDAELNPLGLAHLFVSRDLDDLAPPTRTVGMANLGVLCDRRFGVGLTQATHTTIIDALIAAHELGHNFGAPHDAEAGSACAAESDDFIMAPKISGSTRFSQCSIERMQPEIIAGGCMREIQATDLQLTPGPARQTQVNERETIDFEFVLANLSNTNVAGIELIATSASLSRFSLNADVIADGYCDGTSELRCVWPWFPAGASVMLELSATAGAPGQDVIDITVDSLHELDASDNSLQFDFDILALAELLSLLTPEDASLHPGEAVRFEAAVANRGSEAASGVAAHINIDHGLELIGIELPGCTATQEPERVVHTCPIGTLQAGQSWTFGFLARVPPGLDLSTLAEGSSAGVEVIATSDSVSLAQADRGARAVVTIGETIADLGVAIDGPRLVDIGEEATWQITVTNFGPDPADSIRVFDADSSRTLPSEAASIETDGGDCRLTGGNIEFDCTIDALGVGETATLRLTATANRQGQHFWVEAAAESPAPDGDRDNDRTSLLVSAGSGALAAAPDPSVAGADPVDDDNGGGGSTGILTLILLAVGIWVRAGYRTARKLAVAAIAARGLRLIFDSPNRPFVIWSVSVCRWK